MREFPDAPGITLYGDGSEYFTVLELETVSDPVVNISLDRDSCVHCTSVFDDAIASYTTSWHITLEDRLHYTVTGHDDVSGRNGNASVFTSVADVDADITVSAVSGWALCGVDYRSSDSLISVIATAVMKTLLKIVDPFMDLMKSMQDILQMLSDAS